MDSETLLWRWQEEGLWEWTGGDGRRWLFANGEMLCGGTDGYWREKFDVAAMPEELVIRPWQPGDRIMPFGFDGHHKKLQDVFSDAHVPPEARHAWPVVAADGEILWVPGLVRAEIGRLDDDMAQGVELLCCRYGKTPTAR